MLEKTLKKDLEPEFPGGGVDEDPGDEDAETKLSSAADHQPELVTLGQTQRGLQWEM